MNINFICTLYIAIWAEDELFGTKSKCTKMLGVGDLEAHCLYVCAYIQSLLPPEIKKNTAGSRDYF